MDSPVSELPYVLFAGSSHPELAREIAAELGSDLSPVTIKKFSCGETYVNLEASVRGKDVFIVQTCRSGSVNEDLIELFLLCDAARQNSAKRVYAVVPHFGYSRQDKLHAARESISAKLMADLLVQSGADHIITLHLHSDQNQAFFDVPVENLNARKQLAEYIRSKNLIEPVIVTPDAGGAKMAKKFADELGYPMALLHKTRPSHNVSEITHIVGNVAGKTPIIVDDMIDTAGSVCGAKQALVANGARDEVFLIATHPVFSGPAIERLSIANFTEVVVTNSLPPIGDLPSRKVVSIAPLIASVIARVVEAQSVKSLYF